MADHPTPTGGGSALRPELQRREADIAAVREADVISCKAFVTASTAMAAPGSPAPPAAPILSLPPWTTSLGPSRRRPPHGLPSQYERPAARGIAGPHADAPGLGGLHAAAGPVRHHHPVGAALRAPPPGAGATSTRRATG